MKQFVVYMQTFGQPAAAYEVFADSHCAARAVVMREIGAPLGNVRYLAVERAHKVAT